MTFSSKFDCVSATAKYMCVGEWGLAFCVYEGWVVFFLASVDVDAPCDFHGIPSGPAWGVGVCVNCVVRSGGSCLMEDVTIDGASCCHRVKVGYLDKFAEARVEVG